MVLEFHLEMDTHVIASERMINDDPHVKSSVMFGRGKFQSGLLVEPTTDYAIDPSDTKQLEAFRTKIWFVLWALGSLQMAYFAIQENN